MCTMITLEDLETVHHEMGHVAYYMMYKHLPALFQSGANKAFHEAVGDTIALSSMSVSHLKKLGLLRDASTTSPEGQWKLSSYVRYISAGTDHVGEADLAYLFSKALSSIAFLPFGLLMDKWRWGVFDGSIQPEDYNKAWWALKLKYQGVVPPAGMSTRDDSNYFDPGAKYHIPNSVGYIRYFFSFILQFQFYKGMCKVSGHEGPLHSCDFYGSEEAGGKFKDMLALGSSLPWREALKSLTGETEIHPAAMMEYFEPLRRWLEIENLKSGQRIGWGVD